MALKKLMVCIIPFIISGCNSDTKGLACTAIYAHVDVKFIDKYGQPIVVKNFSAINLRTNTKVNYAGPLDTTFRKGYYAAATDDDRTDISVNGDQILVSATNPNTNQTKTVTVMVGKDFCHVNSVSGPDQVSFD